LMMRGKKLKIAKKNAQNCQNEKNCHFPKIFSPDFLETFYDIISIG